MSRPRVLCIAGSPRRGGNSDRLLAALVEGVAGAGGEPVRLVVSESGVQPCNGCNSCVRTGVCIVNDGMHAVYDALDSADAIAVASPVYFASVPAGLKALYDRCQPYWGRRGHHAAAGAPKRPGCLLLTGGGGDPFGTGCAVTSTRSALAVAGFSIDEVIEAVGVDEPGDIERFPDRLEQAGQAGEDLVARASAGR
jgi:multimeric flavodoxin WrbA